MPGHLERHARSKWEWEAPGARSQERAEAVSDDPARTSTPGRKDRWARCKAAHGGPHVLVLALRAHRFHGSECGWHPAWDSETRGYKAGWMCFHQEQCQNCGKVSRASIPREECPVWPRKQDGRIAAEAEAVRATERDREWREQRARRKPVITGPQGYRRKRSA